MSTVILEFRTDILEAYLFQCGWTTFQDDDGMRMYEHKGNGAWGLTLRNAVMNQLELHSKGYGLE